MKSNTSIRVKFTFFRESPCYPLYILAAKWLEWSPPEGSTSSKLGPDPRLARLPDTTALPYRE